MMSRLNQGWRIIATALCFCLFGFGGLILSFIVIPTIILISKSGTETELKVQHLIQITFDWFCRFMKFTGVMDYKITGAERLKEDKRCLIVANHPSLIDYVLIASQLKQCDCLVKASIWANPFIKRIVKAAGYIPNRNPDDLIKQCEQRFQQGNVLLVFPEGTRTSLGCEPYLQRGAAQIAVRTATNLRVINITVSPSILTKEDKWYRVPKTKPFFHIEVKGNIEVEPFIEQSNNLTTAARRLNQHLSHVIFPSDYL